jgi:large subunit ribosomal protein L1
MAKHGKKYLEAAAKIDRNRNYNPEEALALARETSTVKFDATVEIHMRLGLIPPADQQCRVVVPRLGRRA